MRTYLLPKGGSFYKANLHNHTMFSDGIKTPEEIKEVYSKHGYDIVAFTDHDVFILHNDLTDDKFLALNGFEMEWIAWRGNNPILNTGRCDLCFIALDKDIVKHPVWHRTAYLFGNAVNYRDMVQFHEEDPDYIRDYTPECISEVAKIARDRGFFVTLNHVGWSREDYTYYTNYENLHALELYNGSGILCGHEDYTPRVYDEMLQSGKRIFVIGGDDNHGVAPENPGPYGMGLAWTMIKAEKLEYDAVAKALLNGDMYASDGPEIYDLYIEDGKIHITCSGADQVSVKFDKRVAFSALAEHGELVTEATFDVDPKWGYFRITVKDEHGRVACTRAYFPDEYMK